MKACVGTSERFYIFSLIFQTLSQGEAREVCFAPWREVGSVGRHREFQKWRFWELLKRGTPFLGNPQKPSVYGIFHDFKGEK